jgi:hypothetical protein
MRSARSRGNSPLYSHTDRVMKPKQFNQNYVHSVEEEEEDPFDDNETSPFS